MPDMYRVHNSILRGAVDVRGSQVTFVLDLLFPVQIRKYMVDVGSIVCMIFQIGSD